MKDLSDYRKSYEKSELDEAHAPDFPMELFGKWFQDAEATSSGEEVNVMTVSTIGLDGFPKARIILLKKYDADGFTFFTNYGSEKGKAIAANPNICLSFFWPQTERQVIIKGVAEKVPQADSDEYFLSRPKGSRLGALASNQSEVIASRKVIDDRLAELEQVYPGDDVPRPETWGGYLVRPLEVEFWQGRANRLHDRIRYRKENGWIRERLSP
ncbi:Pyridoxine/pyridoxamine 5'-phosphate oxidase [Flavobacterium longum]|uniref:pyridoxamine 5'-phosphate oxidase n=1 Tax=Flavobacterium longum TaxID=1299340 RepID=UPI0039E78FC1